MKNVMQYGFTSLVICFTAVGLYASKDWNSTTALFPRAVGFPVIALGIAILLLDIKNTRRLDRNRSKSSINGDVEFVTMASRMLN